MSPFFILGSQRSGSTLLRLMLNQLDEIASPHSPHVLECMSPLMNLYGDLNNNKNYSLLIDDICHLIELNPIIWQNMKFNRNEIKLRTKHRSMLGVYESIYDIYAEKQGAKTWCCNSLANIKYLDEIESHFENAKYIYVYRDGRDVALSLQKAVVGDKHIYNIANDWMETQNLVLDFSKKIDVSRFYFISYESLTKEPEASVKSLCEFIEAGYTSEILNFYQSNEAKNTAKSNLLWINVVQPVIKNNSNKYLSEMSFRDIEVFESVAGNILDILGYERSCISLGKEKKYSNEDVAEFNDVNRHKILEKLLNIEKCDIQHRAKQSELLDRIKARFAA